MNEQLTKLTMCCVLSVTHRMSGSGSCLLQSSRSVVVISHSVYQACHDRRVRSRTFVSHGHGIHSVPVTGCDQILEDSANSRPQDCLDVYWITMLCSAELPGIPYLGVFFTCCHHHKCNVLSLSATTTHQPHAHTPICVSAHVRTH